MQREHVCTGTGTQTRAESNESITDMTEGLAFFPTAPPVYRDPEITCRRIIIQGSNRDLPRTRNTAASSYPPINSLRVWRVRIFGGERDQSGIKLPQNVYPIARLKYLRVRGSCP